MNISVSGPHGPLFPVGPHQLSSLPRNFTSFTFSDFQICSDSVSFGASLSPAKHVTEISSDGMLSFFIKNSWDISIASFFQ